MINNLFKYSDAPVKREALINGKMEFYDACSSDSLEVAKASYHKFDYIGSGRVYFIDGVRNEDKTLHFFRHKTNRNEKLI